MLYHQKTKAGGSAISSGPLFFPEQLQRGGGDSRNVFDPPPPARRVCGVPDASEVIRSQQKTLCTANAAGPFFFEKKCKGAAVIREASSMRRPLRAGYAVCQTVLKVLDHNEKPLCNANAASPFFQRSCKGAAVIREASSIRRLLRAGYAVCQTVLTEGAKV